MWNLMSKSLNYLCVCAKQSLQTAIFSDDILSVFINDNPIECVDFFLHLGHVITSNLSDKNDILFSVLLF